MIHAEKNQRFISRTVSDNEVIYHMCTCIVSVLYLYIPMPSIQMRDGPCESRCATSEYIGVEKQGMSHLVCKTGTEAKPKETKDRPHRSQVQVAPQILHCDPLAQSSFYTEKPLHRAASYTEKLLRIATFTHRSIYTQKC